MTMIMMVVFRSVRRLGGQRRRLGERGTSSPDINLMKGQSWIMDIGYWIMNHGSQINYVDTD